MSTPRMNTVPFESPHQYQISSSVRRAQVQKLDLHLSGDRQHAGSGIHQCHLVYGVPREQQAGWHYVISIDKSLQKGIGVVKSVNVYIFAGINFHVSGQNYNFACI